MISFPEACRNYTLLDSVELEELSGGRCLTYENFPVGDEERIPPPPPDMLGAWNWARRMLGRCGHRDALLLNQVDRGAQWACILNSLQPAARRKKLVLYDVFIDTPHAWKRPLISRMVAGATVNVLFSRRQVKDYAAHFRMGEERFAFLPYQSSHSKRDPVVMDQPFIVPDGRGGERRVKPDSYVFAGGNSAREYETLITAAEQTGVPVVICTSRPELVRNGNLPENVLWLSTPEPGFTRLMAGSRFGVLPLTAGRIRGYGEQTILNSFWHARTLIALDDVSASDYIREDEDGILLAPGDVDGLARSMKDLWENPDRCRAMGAAGHQQVADHFHHRNFLHRMTAITRILACHDRSTLDPGG